MKRVFSAGYLRKIALSNSFARELCYKNGCPSRVLVREIAARIPKNSSIAARNII
jgi:hypothetical protein